MLADFLAQVIVGGCVGIILEAVYTGVHSALFLRDRNAVCRTSLWMIPIYGLGCYLMTALRHVCPNQAVFIPVGTLFIFLMEYVSGWLLRKIGVKAWDYSQARFNLHGLIRADYFLFWLMVTVAFDQLADYVSRIFALIGSMA